MAISMKINLILFGWKTEKPSFNRFLSHFCKFLSPQNQNKLQVIHIDHLIRLHCILIILYATTLVKFPQFINNIIDTGPLHFYHISIKSIIMYSTHTLVIIYPKTYLGHNVPNTYLGHNGEWSKLSLMWIHLFRNMIAL